jgi:pyridoxal phosphate enzyme (YggS family)
MDKHTVALDTQIRHNLEVVQNNINKAAKRAGRSPDDIKLVVVTKTHPVEIVRLVIEAGAKFLGENYVAEAQAKIEALGNDAQPSWHMIGHVQSRKAGLVVKYFDYIHSLDSTKLAQRLNQQAKEENRILSVLLELNVSGEESKGGWQLGNEQEWENLFPVIESITILPNLRVCGLMTMPPFSLNPDEVRPSFVKLRQFSEYLSRYFPQCNWEELSMGMSGDYEVAIEEGATLVRIGQAILGPRHM